MASREFFTLLEVESVFNWNFRHDFRGQESFTFLIIHQLCKSYLIGLLDENRLFFLSNSN